jgi:hypothetical protein
MGVKQDLWQGGRCGSWCLRYKVRMLTITMVSLGKECACVREKRLDLSEGHKISRAEVFLVGRGLEGLAAHRG